MHPIENIIESSIESIKRLVDVNTVIGDAVTTADGTLLLPVSRVCVGFAVGGGEYGECELKKKCRRQSEDFAGEDARYPFTGAATVGMSLKPLAFLSVEQGSVRVLPASPESAADKLVDLVPQFIRSIEHFASEMLDNMNKKCENRRGRFKRYCAGFPLNTNHQTEDLDDENSRE